MLDEGSLSRKRQRPTTTLVAQSDQIDKVSDEEIQDIVITANLTPRKCLGFRPLSRRPSKSLARTCKFGSRQQRRSRDVLPKINSNGRRVSVHLFAGVLQSISECIGVANVGTLLILINVSIQPDSQSRSVKKWIR